MTDWPARVLARLVPLLLPPLARSLCARAGFDRAVLADKDRGFDVGHYERCAGRRFRAGDAALFHYLLVGSRAGFQARPGFDPAGYLRRNPDVAVAGYEPFAHYFRFGCHEGRGADAAADAPDDKALAQPDLSCMLRYPHKTGAAAVDIVMPVYGNPRLTLRAIDSVLAAQPKTAHELIVIDDASPDRGLRGDLERLASAGHLTLLVNERNLGFVGTANRGFALHQDRDVVLLNSDTQVYGDWLDRLMAVLHGSPRTGTASPLSNAATILSYPIFLRDNNRLPGMDFAAMDRLCGGLGHAPVELPTALGFCMAIKRACLAEVGPFDEQTFGRGYGEENDFSLRALAVGWRHLAATTVLVWHRGGGSFGTERAALVEAAQQILERMHPGYAASVQRFIARDPLRPVRQALDIARLRDDPRRKVLQIGPRPSSPGDDVLAVEVVPEIGPLSDHLRIRVPALAALPNLPRLRKNASASIWTRIMRDLDLREVQVQPSMARTALGQRVKEAARAAGIRET